MPPINPQKEANLISFFWAKELARAVPNNPCETGSMTISFNLFT